MTGRGNWSARVTRTSVALDLEEGVFTWNNPKRIAASLKLSAEVGLPARIYRKTKGQF